MNAVEIFKKFVEKHDSNLQQAIGVLSLAPELIQWTNDNLLQESPGSKFTLVDQPRKECSVDFNGASFTFALVCSRGSYKDAQCRAERIFMVVDETGVLVGYVRVLGYFNPEYEFSVFWGNIYTEVRPYECRNIEWRA